VAAINKKADDVGCNKIPLAFSGYSGFKAMLP
jgi:hypothetical protein